MNKQTTCKDDIMPYLNTEDSLCYPLQRRAFTCKTGSMSCLNTGKLKNNTLWALKMTVQHGHFTCKIGHRPIMLSSLHLTMCKIETLSYLNTEELKILSVILSNVVWQRILAPVL